MGAQGPGGSESEVGLVFLQLHHEVMDVTEPENNVDAEKNSNGVVAVGQVGLQVFLWQRTEG